MEGGRNFYWHLLIKEGVVLRAHAEAFAYGGHIGADVRSVDVCRAGGRREQSR